LPISAGQTIIDGPAVMTRMAVNVMLEGLQAHEGWMPRQGAAVHRSGEVKALGATRLSRSPLLPDVLRWTNLGART
jgi:hypothetical protein